MTWHFEDDDTMWLLEFKNLDGKGQSVRIGLRRDGTVKSIEYWRGGKLCPGPHGKAAYTTYHASGGIKDVEHHDNGNYCPSPDGGPSRGYWDEAGILKYAEYYDFGGKMTSRFPKPPTKKAEEAEEAVEAEKVE